MLINTETPNETQNPNAIPKHNTENNITETQY